MNETSFLVRDLAQTRRTVSLAALAFRPDDQSLDSLLIDPGEARGLWLEFRTGR